MIELIKARDEIKESLKLENEVCEVYEFLEDNKIIGYGTINKNEENTVSMYISEKYRGNGYGKILFEKLIEELKKIKYKEIYVTFSKNNIRMRKIVEDNKGIEVSLARNKIKYVIPIRY